jgi:hypothetical protein
VPVHTSCDSERQIQKNCGEEFLMCRKAPSYKLLVWEADNNRRIQDAIPMKGECATPVSEEQVRWRMMCIVMCCFLWVAHPCLDLSVVGDMRTSYIHHMESPCKPMVMFRVNMTYPLDHRGSHHHLYDGWKWS